MRVRIDEQLEPLLIDIDSVSQHPRNANNGDLDAITDSLLANGCYRPVIVDAATSHILAGNHLWAAMKALGQTQIPALVLDVPPLVADKILLADNRIAALARMDQGLEIDLLNTLVRNESGDVDVMRLYGTGYQQRDLVRLLSDLDEPITDTDNRSSRDVKILSLTYHPDEWETMSRLLEEAKTRYGAHSNAAAILAALADLLR